jgi:hypothetical protein
MPEGETLVYSLTLPHGTMVRPVDWRRFAYDHSKVAELLGVCVRDNLRTFIFAPWSAAQSYAAEAALTAALGGLSSIFEVMKAAPLAGAPSSGAATPAGRSPS